MAQPRPARTDGFQDIRRAIAVLNVGAMNDEADYQAKRASENMALATLNFFAGVVP